MKKYTCPMHPKVQQNERGTCHLCGMQLVPSQTSLKRITFVATAHCLTGCAIGEVLGMVLGTIFGWPNIETIILSIILAFFFGYSLTLLPLVKSGMSFRKALPIAFASDTISISIMELVDNLIIYFIPGAMDASISSLFFWGSLTFALLIAFVAAYPINMYLISTGKGHAEVHKHS